MIFEDNYPPGQGDCYSLKKVFTQAAGQRKRETMAARNTAVNDFDARMAAHHLDVYYEFPPVIKSENTRWGDAWNDENYPTAAPLLERACEPWQAIFVDEALSYTWICYARLGTLHAR